MKHVFRFLGKQDPLDKNQWLLDLEEMEHAKKVLKLKVGDPVEVMDGVGLIGQGVVSEIVKDQFKVETTNLEFSPKPAFSYAVALGALKPGDIDSLIADLVELGVDEIHVFQQQDTAKFRTSDKSIERWQRIVVSATKQSKRHWLPKIITHESLESAASSLDKFESKCILDPEGTKTLLDKVNTMGKSAAMIIGGEKGLSAKELKVCKDFKFESIRLGKNILRATTAVTSVATILSMI